MNLKFQTISTSRGIACKQNWHFTHSIFDPGQRRRVILKTGIHYVE